jgi:hypothetical protein
MWSWAGAELRSNSKLESMPNKDKLVPILVGRYIMAARLWQQMKEHYDDQDDYPRLKTMSALQPSFFQ